MVKYIVLGGCGFIGRHLVSHLLSLEETELVRSVDKRAAFMCNMPEALENMYDDEENKRIEVLQLDLTKSGKIETALAGDFTVVFNCAADTTLSQPAEVYNEYVVGIAKAAAEQAKANGQKFIHFSDARVYRAIPKDKVDGAPATEEGTIKPSTGLAQAHSEADPAVLAAGGVVLRPSVVYGTGDVSGLTPRILVGMVYKHLKKTMKMLWNGEIRLNTVHVDDVARAAVLCSEKAAPGSVYNLSDEGDTKVSDLHEIIGNMFGIKTGFYGKIVNTAAAASLSMAESTVNDTHLPPWKELCANAGINDLKLSPVIDVELLKKKHLWVDGSKIKELGFTYEHPKLTEEALREVVNEFVAQGFIPDMM